MQSCLDCMYKHTTQAMIIHQEEVAFGYPEDIARVLGHLAEAARHAAARFPDMAIMYRNHRKALLAVRNTPMEYMLPYDKILAFIDLLDECDRQKLAHPELPPELLQRVPLAL